MRTALAALLLSLLGAQPGPPPAPPRPVRIYVLDCGTLNIPDPMPLFGLRKDEVRDSNLSDAAYLIVHPRGTLIWDTGFLSDSAIESGAPQTGMARATTTLKGQLSQAGYRPADIDFLGLSHYHGDHTGNANDFRSATWLVSQVEHDAMFAEPPPRIAAPDTYNALKNSKTVFVKTTADYDVFGDGTVVIKPTPGHTPGHLALVVKLAKTGPVMLTGDMYHYAEEVMRDDLPPGEFDKAQALATRKAVREFIRKTGTTLWIGHDIVGFAKLKKSPEFYE
jgi:glyoxylase-like metal-dependent hydrolase (beta-lactamase superfamily II)